MNATHWTLALTMTSLTMTSSVRQSLANPSKPAIQRAPVVATFSIVACDLQRRQWGVAVQSRVLAVGSLVPFGQAEVGVIATQSYANLTYGPRGLALLKQGHSAKEVVEKLVESDPSPELRQVAVVDSQGRVANYTGSACLEWAGSVTGKNFSCQGNILAGPKVADAMATAYKESEGELADRLIAALEAGQEAGGDKRGQQSAAILVLRKDAGYGGFNDRMIDLRVDDHATPIAELRRLVELTKKQ